MTQSETNGLRKTISRVGGTLAVLLVSQILVLVWWCGTIDTRVGHAEKHIDKLDVRVHAMEVDDRGGVIR